jgi:hypothetical protein
MATRATAAARPMTRRRDPRRRPFSARQRRLDRSEWFSQGRLRAARGSPVRSRSRSRCRLERCSADRTWPRVASALFALDLGAANDKVPDQARSAGRARVDLGHRGTSSGSTVTCTRGARTAYGANAVVHRMDRRAVCRACRVAVARRGSAEGGASAVLPGGADLGLLRSDLAHDRRGEGVRAGRRRAGVARTVMVGSVASGGACGDGGERCARPGMRRRGGSGSAWGS